MSKEKDVKAVIQAKLKEMMKLANEIGTLSEENHGHDDIEMIFNEHSDGMRMLKRYAEMYEISK